MLNMGEWKISFSIYTTRLKKLKCPALKLHVHVYRSVQRYMLPGITQPATHRPLVLYVIRYTFGQQGWMAAEQLSRFNVAALFKYSSNPCAGNTIKTYTSLIKYVHDFNRFLRVFDPLPNKPLPSKDLPHTRANRNCQRTTPKRPRWQCPTWRQASQIRATHRWLPPLPSPPRAYAIKRNVSVSVSVRDVKKIKQTKKNPTCSSS